MDPNGTIRGALGAALIALATPAAAQKWEQPSQVQRERMLNLGLFSGYVVACGFASEEQASEMFEQLKGGLGELSKKDLRVLESARAKGRATKCSDEQLKRAVERGWSNYKNARYAPEPPKPADAPDGRKDAPPAQGAEPAPQPEAPKDQPAPAPSRGP